VCLDADERVECEFRVRAERVIRRGRLLGARAYSVRLRELWDSADQFRVDGVWGRKAPARLFQAREDHEFDSRPLHTLKIPMQYARDPRRLVLADLEVYHLRTIHAAARWERRRRYERLDPGCHYQPGIGYAYLTDERGLRVRAVPAKRRYLQ
jgi:hypothetical protein